MKIFPDFIREISAGFAWAGVLGVSVAVLGFSSPVHAATYTWVGGGNNWGTTARWSGDGKIDTGLNSLVFAGILNPATMNNTAAGYTYAGITFTGTTAFSLSMNSITLSGDVVNQNSSTQTINLAIALSGTGGNFNTTSGNVLVNGAVSGSNLLVKTGAGTAGAGTLILAGNNTGLTGGVQIKNGYVDGGNASAFGTGTIIVGDTNGSNLAGLVGGTFTFGNSITVQAGSSGAKSIQGSLSGDGLNPVFTGNVTLNDNVMLAEWATGVLTMSGTLIGNKTVSVTGNFGATNTRVVLSGNNSLTYTGTAAILSGSLQMGSANALGVSNTVTFASTTGEVSAFDVKGFGVTIAGLNDSGLVTGTVTNSGAATTLTLGGAGSYAFEGAIVNGPTGLAVTKSGSGTQILSGSNTYTGATTVNGGILQIGNGTSGSISSTGTVSTSGGGTLTLKLANGGTFANKIINNGHVNASASGTNTFSGTVSGTGAFNQFGSGMTILSASNSYSGGTTVSSGTLQLGNAFALGGTTGALTVNGGVVDVKTFSPTVGSLSGTGSSATITTLSSGNNATLTTVNSGVNTYFGTIANGSGTMGLTVKGSGTLTLAGASTYTGATNVNAATVIVSGSISGSSAVTVGDAANLSASAVLGGGGTVGNVTVGATAGNSGAKLSPGAGSGSTSAGTTLSTGSVTFTDGSAHLALQIGRTSAFSAGGGTGATGGDVSDHVSTAGTVTLNGADLQLSLLTGTGHTVAEGDAFYLIINESGNAVNGAFASLNGIATTLSEGSLFVFGGQNYQITYQASFATNQTSGGHDVALLAVPEPTTWAMLLGGFGMLIGAQRLRRRQSS